MIRVVSVVGATATGKSGLAMRLALKLDGELVNADALQAYRGFDIGTAKPSIEDRQRVPHHLVDFLDPEQAYSAGEFGRLARAAVREISRRGRLPIVVGGSGFYQKALFEGLAPIPQVPESVRRLLRYRLEREGLQSLYAELLARDPTTARGLAPNDTQRVLRGLEVLEATGQPLSFWHRQPTPFEGALERCQIGLTLPRPILYDRIGLRVEEMVRHGWVDEVRGLLSAAPSSDLPAFQAIGYRQIVRYLKGEWALRDALDDTIQATRRYARRQETWFRKEKVTWLSGQDVDGQLPDIFDALNSRGFGGGS